MYRIRKLFKRSPYLRKLTGYFLASSGLFDNYFKNYSLSDSWHYRLNLILNSEDNSCIPRVDGAGKIFGGKQIMHNGLKIYLGSYYGPEYSVVLSQSKGVHEPQEERVFQEVLKILPKNSTMLELGSFWSFYSMWFNKEVDGARNFMIEPDSFNLGQGKRNFRLNKMKGYFIQAFIGKETNFENRVQILSVDTIIRDNNINFLDLLHSDIQGYEYDMLLGAKKSFAENKIGYVFISTHSNAVHYKCLNFLQGENFIIVANADLDASFSEDGLIVGRAPHYKGIDPIRISLRNQKL